MAAYLLYERGRGAVSKWAPYIAQLPSMYTTFMTWRANEIAELPACALQAEHAINQAAEATETLHDAWQLVHPLLQALGGALLQMMQSTLCINVLPRYICQANDARPLLTLLAMATA